LSSGPASILSCLGSVALLALGLAASHPAPVEAKILRHVDADGVIWFTNIPSASEERKPQQPAVEARGARRSGRVQSHPYRVEVERLALRHGLNPGLVSALMAVESDFDPDAVSPKGAQGLMQLMPLITKYYRVYNPFDPQQNIEGGIRYLSDMLRLFDNKLPLALAAYNGGEGLVRKHGGVPPFLESYVNKVLTLYEQARGRQIHRYSTPSGLILFSNVPLSQEQLSQWEAKR
jgi:soluble lytic murein transglycosylase-like protein